MSSTLSEFFREPRSLSIASRRRTRYLCLLDQRSTRVSALEPTPATSPSPDFSTPPSPASGKQIWGNFSFQATDGRVVGFPRASLLSRAIEFTLPPSYDSLEAEKSLPSPPVSPQPSDRGRSFAATNGRETNNRLVVHVRDISPVASQGSMPSYRAVSPPPPRDVGYYPYIIAGMEIDEDDMDDDAPMRRSLHQFQSAPFSSHPDMPPCTAPACPMRSAPHNQGLYFHYGMRPGPLLRESLRHHGVNGIWDGGNPPNLVWACLIASQNGDSTMESRVILRNYMRLHCTTDGYYTPVIRRRDEEKGAYWRNRRRFVEQRRLEAEAASMPVLYRGLEVYTVPPEPISRAHSPVQDSQVEEALTGTNMTSVQDWAQDVTAAAPDTPQPRGDLVAASEQSVTNPRYEGGESLLSQPLWGEDDRGPSSGSDDTLGTPYTSDVTTVSQGELDPTLNDSGSFIPNFHGDPDFVTDDRRTTTLTYWSTIPDTNANFLRLGLLPPTRHQTDLYPLSPTPPTLLCTSPACPIRTPHTQNTYTQPPHPSHPPPTEAFQRVQRERIASFLDNVGLEAIWGDSYPDPTVFGSLVRLVQDACLYPEGDVEVVERFRAFHGFGNRAVVGEGEEVGGEEEEDDLGMGEDEGWREDEGKDNDEESGDEECRMRLY